MVAFRITVEQQGRSQTALLDPSTGPVALSDVVAGTAIGAALSASGLEFSIDADRAWDSDVAVTVSTLVEGARALNHPMHEGIVERRVATDSAYEFRGPGWVGAQDNAHRLALPFVEVETAAGGVLVGTDPGFTTKLAYADTADGTEVSLRWVYRHEAGRHEAMTRTVVVRPVGDVEAAIDAWFATATPDIPVGPGWLKDIAWTNYDYLSKDGRGWFADIDAFVDIVGGENTDRAAFTLHGWYDKIGRYCFDPATRTLDRTWTAFPFIHDPQLLAIEGVVDPEIPHNYYMRNLRDYEPVELSWEGIRERIGYAKERGLRVPFYFAAGLMGFGNSEEHVRAGDGLESDLSLWVGPDAVGETYLMNPLDPAVREWFLDYARALLDEIGDLIDALVVDETCFIRYGQLGPESRPGYADLAQSTLLAELTAMCHAFRPDLAVLTADQMGLQIREDVSYPYCLYADGIYQDTFCHPQMFEASLFPTWRNVAWSCNWAPVSTIRNTKWAVLAYDAPLSTSNGCFGDDQGLADMSDAARETFHELWERKLDGRRRRRLTVVDVAS
jgi:hypothetical protein